MRSDSRKLDDLLNRMSLGVLSAQDHDELDQILATDVASRQQYLERTFLMGQLAWRLRSSAEPVEAVAAPRPSRTPVVLASLRQRIPGGEFAVGALVVAVVAAAFWGLATYTWRPGANNSIAALPIGGAVAFVDLEDDWQLLDRTRQTSDGRIEIVAGQKLTLASGMAAMQLASGVELTLHGPLTCTVDGGNKTSLEVGRLYAQVPPAAVGFEVKTADVTIRDLGTEFGVEVTKEGETDVAVVVGKVDVYARTPADTSTAKSQSGTRVVAGEAKRFNRKTGSNGGMVTEIAPWVPAKQQGKKTAKPSRLPDETQYAAAVLADHPDVYWRFSDHGNDIADDASGNRKVGRYQEFVSSNNPGLDSATNDQSVQFLGTKIPGWLELPDFELSPSFSVECWVQSATPTWTKSAWFVSANGPDEIFLSPLVDTRAWQFYIRVAESYHTVGAHEPDRIDDAFHHYVCTYDAAVDTATMYFDGEQVSQKANAVGPKAWRNPVRMTLNIGRDARSATVRCGEGWMDEFAIYPAVLSAEAVRRHFNAGFHPASRVNLKP